jgi:hypothetical protein
MRKVKIFGEALNCEADEDSGTGDFVERVVSESGEPAGTGIHECVQR